MLPESGSGTVGRSSDSRMRTYWSLLPDRPLDGPVSASLRRSSPLTAAGQFRIYAGFPLHREGLRLGRRSARTDGAGDGSALDGERQTSITFSTLPGTRPSQVEG